MWRLPEGVVFRGCTHGVHNHTGRIAIRLRGLLKAHASANIISSHFRQIKQYGAGRSGAPVPVGGERPEPTKICARVQFVPGADAKDERMCMCGLFHPGNQGARVAIGPADLHRRHPGLCLSAVPFWRASCSWCLPLGEWPGRAFTGSITGKRRKESGTRRPATRPAFTTLIRRYGPGRPRAASCRSACCVPRGSRWCRRRRCVPLRLASQGSRGGAQGRTASRLWPSPTNSFEGLRSRRRPVWRSRRVAFRRGSLRHRSPEIHRVGE